MNIARLAAALTAMADMAVTPGRSDAVPSDPTPTQLPTRRGRPDGSRKCGCGRTISANKDSCLACSKVEAVQEEVAAK